MSTIPSYPSAAPLEGDELLPLWQNGGQVAVPMSAVVQAATALTQGIAVNVARDAAGSHADALSAKASLDALALAIAGYPNGATLTMPIGSRLLLAAIAHPGGCAFLLEAGRLGAFVWRSGDQSALVQADPQQGVCVAPSSDPTGHSGAWLRDYAGRLNWCWFGANGNGVATSDNLGLQPGFTDNTAAIQATIDFNFWRGGGSIGGPDGIYGLSSAATVRNGMANILHAPSIGDITNMQVCDIRGETPAARSGVTNKGLILWSTVVASADANGNRPGVIGCPPGPDGISYCQLRTANLIIRQPQNPSCHGVLARYCHIADMADTRIDAAGGITTDGPTAVLTMGEPTRGVAGWWGPENNLPYNNTLSRTLVFGFDVGYECGELVIGEGVVGASACKVGMNFRDGYHPSKFSFVELVSCCRAIGIDTDNVGQEIYVDLITIEKSHNVPGWIVYGNDITDPHNKLRGTIRYHEHESGLSHLSPFLDPDARNLCVEHYYSQDQAGNAFSRIFPNFPAIVTASSMRERIGTPTGTPWDSYIVSTTDPTAAVGAKSWSNFGGPAPNSGDYRVAQISVIFDGTVRRGAVTIGTARDGVFKNHIQWDSFGRMILLTQPPVYADEMSAKAAGVPQNTVYERPDGSLARQRLA